MALAVRYEVVAGMLLSENRGGVETEFIPDPFGNVIQCRDSSGSVTYEATYSAYGEIESETGTNPSTLGFAGVQGVTRETSAVSLMKRRFGRPGEARWQTAQRQKANPYDWQTWPIFRQPPGRPDSGLYTGPIYTGKPGNPWDYLWTPGKSPRLNPLYSQNKDCTPYTDPGYYAFCFNKLTAVNCIQCLRPIQDIAQDMMENLGFPKDPGGIGDAFRHCYANCLAVRGCGCHCATFSDAREFSDPLNMNPPPELAMDLDNNAIGRWFGAGKADCKKACQDAALDGDLHVVR